MDIRAEITREDIELAKSRDRGHCAIARAVARKYPDVRYVRVDRNEVRFSDLNNRVRYVIRTPPAARQFVDNFDAGKSVDGFRLVLRDNDIVDMRVMKSRSPNDVGKGTKRTKSPGTGVSPNRRQAHGGKEVA